MLMADCCLYVQGVIGDTYYHESKSPADGATADTPESNPVIPHYTDLVYPVFPDSAYEVPTLFDSPSITFPTDLVRDIIASRVAIVKRMQGAGSNNQALSK